MLALGDLQYECADAEDFERVYHPTWDRLRDRTYLVAGNHEYSTSTFPASPCFDRSEGAPGYFAYFGGRASPNELGCRVSCRGYYSFDLGGWHLVALNSNCSKVGGCHPGSPQMRWLAEDLAEHAARCTLAFMHRPRWGSGSNGDRRALVPLWTVLQESGVDLVLSGHDHQHERFAPMDAEGELDETSVIPQFVVGTGGKEHFEPNPKTLPNSVVRDQSASGVLRLRLGPDSYQ